MAAATLRRVQWIEIIFIILSFGVTSVGTDEANIARCRSLLLTADEKLVAKLLTLCCFVGSSSSIDFYMSKAFW